MYNVVCPLIFYCILLTNEFIFLICSIMYNRGCAARRHIILSCLSGGGSSCMSGLLFILSPSILLWVSRRCRRIAGIFGRFFKMQFVIMFAITNLAFIRACFPFDQAFEPEGTKISRMLCRETHTTLRSTFKIPVCRLFSAETLKLWAFRHPFVRF